MNQTINADSQDEHISALKAQLAAITDEVKALDASIASLMPSRATSAFAFAA